MAMIGHLSGIVAGFIGPLIIWLINKEKTDKVWLNDQAKEALNFNITMAIIAVVLLLITVLTLGIGIILAVPAGIIIGIAWLVLVIMATIKSNEGERYRYPFCLRLIK